MECRNDLPLVEQGPITDVFAEGIDRIEIIGENARLIYWRWRVAGEIWERVALDWALVRPIRSLHGLLEPRHGIRVIRPPGAEVVLVQ